MTQDECRPCAFLDRDGVINVDHGYVWRPQDLEFMPGAPEAVAMLNAADYLVVVVTNQSGVARGMYSEINVVDFHSYMHEMLKMHGGHVDAFYYCPYHADAIVTAFRHPDHPDRKPNPGMIERAMRDLPIRREGSFLIGDKDSDMEAARRASIPGYLFAGGRLDSFAAQILGGSTQV
ncbi:MAG: HAD family hydrolase [Rhodobiaceae bacterium]|nr:HAD family hydrolase [Rhodobiaceae bacterium]MCC0049142.1 HAD family hydrolase [Rhodobiaceae bacterium]